MHVQTTVRFRWDDYDLKQPLVGNTTQMADMNGSMKRLSSSSGDLTKKTQESQLKTPPPLDKSDRPPIKLDGLSAEILSATGKLKQK